MRSFVIVWGAGLNQLPLIKHKISKNCKILSSKIYRFRSEDTFDVLAKIYTVPKNILVEKIRDCNCHLFALISIEVDADESYVLHRRSPLRVVEQLHNLKISLRSLFRGKPYIHTPDTLEDASYQHKLILGSASEFFIQNTIDRIDEIFDVLSSSEYVVLRNEEFMIWESIVGVGDIDILCYDKRDLVDALKLKKVPRYSARYMLESSGQKYQFDLREVNDGYYDPQFSKDILSSKIRSGSFWLPNNEHKIYAYIHHILFHKQMVQLRHVEYLNFILGNFALPTADIQKSLIDYYQLNNYKITLPEDSSVSMNIPRLRRFAPEIRVNHTRYVRFLKTHFKQKMKHALTIY